MTWDNNPGSPQLKVSQCGPLLQPREGEDPYTVTTASSWSIQEVISQRLHWYWNRETWWSEFAPSAYSDWEGITAKHWPHVKTYTARLWADLSEPTTAPTAKDKISRFTWDQYQFNLNNNFHHVSGMFHAAPSQAVAPGMDRVPLIRHAHIDTHTIPRTTWIPPGPMSRMPTGEMTPIMTKPNEMDVAVLLYDPVKGKVALSASSEWPSGQSIQANNGAGTAYYVYSSSDESSEGGGVDESGMAYFGGKLPRGQLDDTLWIGRFEGRQDNENDPGSLVVAWRRVPYAAGRPEGRTLGTLLNDVWGRSLVLFGGVDADENPVSGVWRYDLVSDEWKEDTWKDMELPALAGAGIAVDNDTAYIFGGVGASGYSDKIYRVFLPSLQVKVVGSMTPGPGPRAVPAVAYHDPLNDRAHGSPPLQEGRYVYLFGGKDESNWRNDLWRFNLKDMNWERVMNDCTSGACPPATKGAFMAPDAMRGQVTVFMGDGPEVRDGFWRLTTDKKWMPARRIIDPIKAADCDGDGSPSREYGAMCRNVTSWWGPYGEKVCDTFTNALACDAPAGKLKSTDYYPKLWGGVVAFDLYKDMVVLVRKVLQYNSLEIVQVKNGKFSPLSGTIITPLGYHAYDVVVYGKYAYVATDTVLIVFDLSTPQSPTEIQRIYMANERVRDLEISGSVLYALGTNLETYSLHEPRIPTLLASMDPYEKQDYGQFSWEQLLNWPAPQITVMNGVAFVSDWSTINVMDIRNAASLYKIGFFHAPKALYPILKMRARDGLLYLNRLDLLHPLSPPKDVFDCSDPQNCIYAAGDHNVISWVRGLKEKNGKVYDIEFPWPFSILQYAEAEIDVCRTEDCSYMNDQCSTGSCNNAAGGCVRQYAAPETSCNDDDPCTLNDRCDKTGHCNGDSLVCEDPPENECLDASTARKYQAQGACSAGACEYAYEDEMCRFGCQEGECQQGPI